MTEYKAPVSDALMKKMAWDICQNRALFDDLVQEGHIEVWRLWQRYPDKPRGFFERSAKRRMNAVGNRNRPMLGEQGHPGKPMDPLRREHESLEALAERGDDGIS